MIDSLTWSHVAVGGVCKALRGVTVTVPRAVRAGHSVTLECDYDLENAALYSVKWYRGSDEFYRFVPKEEPPTRVFPLPGLKVDVSIYFSLLNAPSTPVTFYNM